MISKRKLCLTLVAFLLAAGVGCHRKVNQNNPQVVRAATLLDASNTCVTIEDGLVAANHAVESIESQDPEYYAKVKPLLRKVSSANVEAVHKIKTFKDGDTSVNWRAGMLAVASSINTDDLSALQIKNPTTQLIVSASLATLVGALNAIPKSF